MNFDFICMKMNLMKNKKYLQQKTQQRWRGYSNVAVRGWLGE